MSCPRRTGHCSKIRKLPFRLDATAPILVGVEAGAHDQPTAPEARWQLEHRRALARRTRSAAWVLGGCWCAFVALDLLTLAPEVRGNIVSIEVALGLLVVPALALLARRPALPGMPATVAVLLAVTGLGIEAKMGAIAAAGSVLRYDGLLLYVLGVYTLSGLSWRAAAATGVVLGAGWVALVSACALEREVMTSIYMACANVIGITSTWLTEQLQRESLARRVMVERERERVQRLADELEEQSLRDPLTGLRNRRGLAQHGESLWASARRSGRVSLVAMVDVDHFKAYNDQHGHPAGDRVLQQVACALSSVAHGRQAEAFRYGGEEFTVLFVVDSTEEIGELSRQMHAAVAALGIRHPSSHTRDTLTVSVGLAAGAPTESLQQAMARADALLYEAKHSGRARTAFAQVF